MASSTVEDYIKQLFLLEQQFKGEKVPMGHLSEAVGITPGTATTMVKAMASDGLVRYTPRVGVNLTAKGHKLAANVLRRHRIAECFLVKILGMDWSEVHEDAERLEHAISDKVLDRMDALLDRPTHDPHGDPIPALDGRLKTSPMDTLLSVKAGDSVTVARILDQSPAFLSFAHTMGLMPGAMVVVKDRNELAESVSILLPRGDVMALSFGVAGKIGVAALTSKSV